MSTINFTVIDHEITADNPSIVLAQDSNNFDTCKFTFDKSWEGYSKEAIFYQNIKKVIKVSLIDNSCKIPKDALLYNRTLYIGVRGKNSESSIATTKMASFFVCSGAIDGQSYEQTEITQSQLEQLLSSIDRKFDKYCGSENVGKYLKVGSDGYVELVEESNGKADLTNYYTRKEIDELLSESISSIDFPKKLPNPNPLTFSGAATGSYDGSSELNINIPIGTGDGSTSEIATVE